MGLACAEHIYMRRFALAVFLLSLQAGYCLQHERSGRYLVGLRLVFSPWSRLPSQKLSVVVGIDGRREYGSCVAQGPSGTKRKAEET